MFYYLSGSVAEIEPGLAVIDCGGVGYACATTNYTLAQLKKGERAKLYTHMNVRDDALDLFGFASQSELNSFKMLIGVSGVGPKGALGILSSMSPDDLRMAIVTGDSKAISRAPGVGSKTAQRIVLDLKDKLDASEVFNTALDHGPSGGGSAFAGAVMAHSAQREAVEALVALGYSETEAGRAVKKVEINGDMTVDQILKRALKNLSFL
jgi:Holliday junction DNA helicase RuvA